MNDLAWFKSSYSGGDGGNCLEVSIRSGAAGLADPAVHVRDSKDPHGPALRFEPGEWAAFVDFARGTRIPA